VIPFERLVALSLGELPEEVTLAVEEHVLGCSECASVLERLVELRESVAAATRNGRTPFLAGHLLTERADREGMVTRRYEVNSGGEVACTVGARDVYTLVRLGFDAEGVQRIDLSLDAPDGSRIKDVPFDPERREIVYLQPAEFLRTLPSSRRTFRVFAVDGDESTLIGEYVFDHTAYEG
jgi:hypothetical protein